MAWSWIKEGDAKFSRPRVDISKTGASLALGPATLFLGVSMGAAGASLEPPPPKTQVIALKIPSVFFLSSGLNNNFFSSALAGSVVFFLSTSPAAAYPPFGVGDGLRGETSPAAELGSST
jgi:hypothetical protein